MPSLEARISQSTAYSVDTLPPNALSALKADPRNSNIIYSHVLKSMRGQSGLPDTDKQVWIVCSSNDDRTNPVDFMLSCTTGPTGTYPIFIFCTHPPSKLDDYFLRPRINLLARTLRGCINVERVFSVFALGPVANMFAAVWNDVAGVAFDPKPYYSATLTFCTSNSLQKKRHSTIFADFRYELRLAVHSDIPAVAELCYGFAEKSEPFVETRDQSVQEATQLIEKKQVWVHTIIRSNQPEEIASIVAVTRDSPTVAAITKVYTNPDWRLRRCAERLVRHVCQTLLRTKESVVLYVACDNQPARKVYHRVGFVGLSDSTTPVEGVDHWLEIGFDRNIVELGHW